MKHKKFFRHARRWPRSTASSRVTRSAMLDLPSPKGVV